MNTFEELQATIEELETAVDKARQHMLACHETAAQKVSLADKDQAWLAYMDALDALETACK